MCCYKQSIYDTLFTDYLDISVSELSCKYYNRSYLFTAHPNVKLFITQAGLQSTDEAITAGVPLVGIPMLADQWYNAQKYTRHGIGVQLDMALLTEDDFRNAIEKVINDKR